MSKVLCVGTLIIDIINKKIERIPNEGETVTTEVSLNLGGNAYSSSVNIKRLAPQEMQVYCYGRIGTDALGSLFENGLNKEGVICRLSKVPEKKTSCNIILQEKGKERRYIFDAGANSSAVQEDLLKTIDEIEPDSIIFGEIPTIGMVGPEFVEIVNYVKAHYNSLVILDLLAHAGEDYGWIGGNWSNFDVVHCNFWEGRQVTKQATLKEICQFFLDKGVILPIVSDGQNGCRYGYRNRINQVQAFTTEEIDATGAGDALLAGIVKGLLELQDDNRINIKNIDHDILEKIVTYGSACGAIAVGALGCVNDISVEMVESLLGRKSICEE